MFAQIKSESLSRCEFIKEVTAAIGAVYISGIKQT